MIILKCTMVLTLANVFLNLLFVRYVLYLLPEIIKYGHNVTVKKPRLEEQKSEC